MTTDTQRDALEHPAREAARTLVRTLAAAGVPPVAVLAGVYSETLTMVAEVMGFETAAKLADQSATQLRAFQAIADSAPALAAMKPAGRA